MEKWNGKVAVVTGASSGIGEETCRQLVEKGMIVVGFARREDKLQVLEDDLKGKPGKFYYHKVDLCSEENILEAFNWVKKTLKSVDVLINNAGVWKHSDLLGNTNDWKQMFETNVIGANICSREAIKIMEEIQIKEGHIININSVAGHYLYPFMKDISVYGATKHSVTAITECLRELMGMKNLPIRVTSISPGAVETDMIDNLSKLEGVKMLKPIDIAEAIMYALSAPQRVNVLEEDLKGKLGKFYYLKVDLCSEENILEAFNWIKKTLKSIDVFINNAGVWKYSDVLGNTNDWKQMFDTNVIGGNICSREAIKIMEKIQIKEGHIININSVVGHYLYPFEKDISVYSATKHSVTAITECLREFIGMKNLPIRVTSISPGAVETEMTESLSKLEGVNMLKSIDIADAIMSALSAPQRVNISEIIIRPRENTLSFVKKLAQI